MLTVGKYDRTVIAYHGCDAKVAERLLAGESFTKSENDYDWLGEGIYFWEYGADRAMRFAEDQKKRRRVQTPAIVGALIQLGDCFDLMDTKFTKELRSAHAMLKKIHDDQGSTLPVNGGGTPDKKLRRLDCAVLNFYLSFLERTDGIYYDSVRCGFVEGGPAFDGSGIREHSHVQLCRSEPRLHHRGVQAHNDGDAVKARKRKPTLDPEAPGLDAMTRRRRRALAELEAMTPAQVFEVAVQAGIYTKDGKLTKHYRSDGEPSKHRPTD